MEQAGGQFVIRLKKPRMSLLTSMLQEQTLSTEITKENNFEVKLFQSLKPNNLNVLKQRLKDRGSDSTEGYYED